MSHAKVLVGKAGQSAGPWSEKLSSDAFRHKCLAIDVLLLLSNSYDIKNLAPNIRCSCYLWYSITVIFDIRGWAFLVLGNC